MRKIILSLLMVAATCYIVYSQQDAPSPRNSMTVVFYNVENLFDTVNDPSTNDDEFTGNSPKQWNQEKYSKKLSDLASVLASVSERELPALIGLCEVENGDVLRDLVNTRKLGRGNYGIAHFESRDERGIDVALLYSQDEIELLESKPVPVVFSKDINDLTRDILYAKCRIKGDRIIHVFVNHWPSRSPNQEESEIKRVTAAVTLRREIDNILNFENDAAILVMGDFNDEPTNRSVMQVLNAANKRKNQHYRDLFNLMYDQHNISGEGTLVYKENWQMFDQMIISQSLLKTGSGYYCLPSDGKVFKNELVVRKDPSTGNPVISRTYAGDKYLGGVSDHLPVYLILRKEGK